jgi:hypothetical protein
LEQQECFDEIVLTVVEKCPFAILEESDMNNRNDLRQTGNNDNYLRLLKLLCLGVVMTMISSLASAGEFKTGQQLIEEGYRVMDEYELEIYLVNRTVYTRARKANGELSKGSAPSYHHESG